MTEIKNTNMNNLFGNDVKCFMEKIEKVKKIRSEKQQLNDARLKTKLIKKCDEQIIINENDNKIIEECKLIEDENIENVEPFVIIKKGRRRPKKLTESLTTSLILNMDEL